MAHLSLQIGAAIAVPIGNGHWHGARQAWRRRALEEVAEAAMPTTSWPVPQLRPRRAHGYKLRGAARLPAVAECV